MLLTGADGKEILCKKAHQTRFLFLSSCSGCDGHWSCGMFHSDIVDSYHGHPCSGYMIKRQQWHSEVGECGMGPEPFLRRLSTLHGDSPQAQPGETGRCKGGLFLLVSIANAGARCCTFEVCYPQTHHFPALLGLPPPVMFFGRINPNQEDCLGSDCFIPGSAFS